MNKLIKWLDGLTSTNAIILYLDILLLTGIIAIGVKEYKYKLYVE